MKETEIVKFSYRNETIQFNPGVNSVMVNATQMAKLFPNKRMNDFISNENTKEFIKAYSQSGNSRYEIEFTEEGKLVKIVKGHSSINGTWMDRVVALKFAAWLNPEFELWVYQTIESLLFNKYNRFIEAYQQTETIKAEIKVLQVILRNNPDYIRLKELQKKQSRISKALKNFNPETTKLFE